MQLKYEHLGVNQEMWRNCMITTHLQNFTEGEKKSPE